MDPAGVTQDRVYCRGARHRSRTARAASRARSKGLAMTKTGSPSPGSRIGVIAAARLRWDYGRGPGYQRVMGETEKAAAMIARGPKVMPPEGLHRTVSSVVVRRYPTADRPAALVVVRRYPSAICLLPSHLPFAICHLPKSAVPTADRPAAARPPEDLSTHSRSSLPRRPSGRARSRSPDRPTAAFYQPRS